MAGEKGKGIDLNGKFQVVHRGTGKEAADAFVLVPRRDLAAWVAARVYAALCAPDLAEVLVEALDRVWAEGLMLGEQGRRNEPHAQGGREAVGLFLDLLDLARAGKGVEVREYVDRMAERVWDERRKTTSGSAVPDAWEREVSEILAGFPAGEVVSAEAVARQLRMKNGELVRGGPPNELAQRVDRALLAVSSKPGAAVERYGFMTYRRTCAP